MTPERILRQGRRRVPGRQLRSTQSSEAVKKYLRHQSLNFEEPMQNGEKRVFRVSVGDRATVEAEDAASQRNAFLASQQPCCLRLRGGGDGRAMCHSERG